VASGERKKKMGKAEDNAETQRTQRRTEAEKCAGWRPAKRNLDYEVDEFVGNDDGLADGFAVQPGGDALVGAGALD
jgi:hypothetical protein